MGLSAEPIGPNSRLSSPFIIGSASIVIVNDVTFPNRPQLLLNRFSDFCLQFFYLKKSAEFTQYVIKTLSFFVSNIFQFVNITDVCTATVRSHFSNGDTLPAPPTIFGRSINLIPTGIGQIIPTYYWPLASLSSNMYCSVLFFYFEGKMCVAS